MTDIDLTLIGAELRRLQHDMRELRVRVDYNNSEGRALNDVLREEIARNIAGLHARMDAFDQRFAYLDEAISESRQEFRREIAELRQELRQEITGFRQEFGREIAGLQQEMNNQFDELKALLLNGRAG
jgi:glutamine synthetase